MPDDKGRVLEKKKKLDDEADKMKTKLRQQEKQQPSLLRWSKENKNIFRESSFIIPNYSETFNISTLRNLNTVQPLHSVCLAS